jgi:hypothetical protein
MLVTSLMRYDAHVSRGGMWMDPVLPKSYGDLHITNAPMGGGRITTNITGSEPSVQGLAEGLTFHREHRPWLTELLVQAGWGGRLSGRVAARSVDPARSGDFA